MPKGAPDWAKIVYLRALGLDGNVHDVLVDSAGRLVMLAYGGVEISGPVDVNQLNSTRTIQGADGITLRTVTVDADGRLVMVPKGKYGSTYLDLTVDVNGNLVSLMKGTDGATLRTLLTDAAGRLLTVIRDPVSENYAAISSDGYLGAVLRGASDVTLDLELWSRFRQAEGIAVLDYSGNAHVGIPYASSSPAAVYGDGAVGDGLYLSGVDTVVDYGTSSDFNFTTGPFTVELWYKSFGVVSDGYLVNRSIVDTSGWSILLLYGGKVSVATRQLNTTQSSLGATSVIDSVWHHIVVTRLGSTVKIYVDGVDDTASATNHVNPATCSTNLFLGARSLTLYEIPGTYDEFRIYSRALTATEILWRYRRTRVSEDSRYRALAVDPEGRLEVNMSNLPYKRQVLASGCTVYDAGGNHNLQSAIVPAGEAHIITSAICFVDATAANSIAIGIYDGAQDHLMAYEYGSSAVWRAVVHGQLTLKAGDRLNFGVGHAATAYSLYWSMSGYVLESD